MIRNTQVLWPALSAALLGVALAGCGGNSAQTASAPATTTTTTDTKAAGDGHTHAPGEAAHSHDNDAPSTGAQAPAELAAFFPGAALTKKAFPLDAAHLNEMGGVKFSGDEKEWEVYEASRNGARQGYAVMTHFSGSGGDTHAVFAVDKSFKITRADAVDAPAMKPLMAQAVGKSHGAKWKVGQDFKPVAGVPAKDAQAAVDALHKGVLILEENFNPNHGEHTGGAGHENAPGHKDDGHSH